MGKKLIEVPVCLPKMCYNIGCRKHMAHNDSGNEDMKYDPDERPDDCQFPFIENEVRNGG